MVYNNNKNWYLINLSSHNNLLDTFMIKEYHYVGFSFWRTDYWTKQNSSIFTLEEHTSDEADSERFRWCIVISKTHQGVDNL